MVDAFGQCSDGCGWVAAVVAALSYGSFGVPIKYTKDIDVHPLVLQSYKTFAVFTTCWFVFLLGVDLAFSRWGFLSGLLWVLGGTGGVYAIRMAGLAIAVGTWASVMVMVNFVFGILIFKEPVYDLWGTMASFLLLIAGLVGMSHFSATPPLPSNIDEYLNVISPMEEEEDPTRHGKQELLVGESEPTDDHPHAVLFGRLPLSKRQCGISGAVWNGLLTGGSLVPLHYAKEEGFGGARFIISMSCGAFLSNMFVWVMFFAWNKIHHPGASIGEVYETMPRWHVRKLWLPGSIAGILLSFAMFGSVLAVTYLGQGVGNSLVQTKILVSGIWGIFWFKEIAGTGTVAKWFLSAATAVAAIVWLSFERLWAKEQDGSS